MSGSADPLGVGIVRSGEMARDLSVRLGEDQPGQFAQVVQALSESAVNIEGIAMVNGIVHVLARDPNAARSALGPAATTSMASARSSCSRCLIDPESSP